MKTHYVFDSIKLKSIKAGVCKCGKKLKRSKTFEQTINPYNRNSQGLPKNSVEINIELKQEAENWKPNFICNNCSEKETPR